MPTACLLPTPSITSNEVAICPAVALFPPKKIRVSSRPVLINYQPKMRTDFNNFWHILASNINNYTRHRSYIRLFSSYL